MPRIERVNMGVTRYIDSQNPTVNNGGELVKFGRMTDENLSTQIYYIIVKFDVENIVGGKPRFATMYFYTNEIAEDINNSEPFMGFVRLNGYAVNKELDIENCNLGELQLNAIDPSTEVGYGDIVEDNKAAVSKGEYFEFMASVPSNIEQAYVATKYFASYPIYIYPTYRYAYNDTPPYGVMGEFSSFKGANPPYLEIELDEAEIAVASATPANGFIEKTQDNTFSWAITYDETYVIGKIEADSAVFRWKNENEENAKEISIDGNSYTIPANTITGDFIQWQVEVTTNAGTVATSEWFTLTTIDAPATSIPLSPINQKILRTIPHVFAWSHATENGTAQTAADLQYSTDGVYWENLISVTGSEQSVVVPANSLPIGTVYWRVRTYNANGVAGEWSDTAVILVDGGIVPVISSVSNEAFANVMWTAEQQQGYEVVIESDNKTYKSGVQLGTEKRYRFKKPLADGSYTAKVRVYYNNGETSPWAEYPFLLSTEKPTAPIISASPIINGVKIDVIAENDVYILRNGEVIGKAINGEFNDYAATGDNLYTARAVNESYNFADSLAIKASPVIVGSVIATADKPEKTLQLSLNLNGQPQREFSWEQLGGITHYAGRKYPVYEHAEQESESYNFAFAFRTREEYEKFINLAKQKKPMLYRDQYGLKVYGIITGVSPSVSWAGYAVTFSVTKIDYNEAVEYDL